MTIMNTATVINIKESPEKYQIENGEFCKIANQIIYDLSRTHFTPAESQLIHFVIRYTYGFNRKTARLSLHFISEKTGLPFKRASKAINSLLDKNVLFREGGQNGEIGYQKYADRWRFASSPKTETSPKTENSVRQKRRTHEITPYKRLNTTIKRIGDFAAQSPATTTIPYEKIVAAYHQSLPDNPRVMKLTDRRKSYIKQRWMQNDLPDLKTWESYFSYCNKSRFLTGKENGTNGRPPFIANLEWLCKPNNFVEIWEGKYHRGIKHGV